MCWLQLFIWGGGLVPQLRETRSTSSLLLVDDKVLQYKRVHFALHERVVRIGGSGNNRLPAQVERGIQDHRHSSGLAKTLDQSVVAGTLIAEDGLQTSGA